MTFFKNLFGGASSEAHHKNGFPWNGITDEAVLEEIDELSLEQPILIFKHSTGCFVSKTVLRQFEAAFPPGQIPCYYLDLLRYRQLSNAIAARYAIEHQSPQLLLIKNKTCIYNASHSAIDADTVQGKLD